MKTIITSSTLLTLKDGSKKFIEYDIDESGKQITFRSTKPSDSISIELEHKINTYNVVDTMLVLFDMEDSFNNDSSAYHYGIPLSGFESKKEFFNILEQSVSHKRFENDYLHSGSGATNDCKICLKMMLTKQIDGAVLVGKPSASQKNFLKSLGFI
jgi:hypothetical protein